MKETFCSDSFDAEIRDEAYRLFVASGRAPGRDLEHWLLAEHLVQSRRAAAGSTALQPENLLHFPLNEKAIAMDTPHPFPPRR